MKQSNGRPIQFTGIDTDSNGNLIIANFDFLYNMGKPPYNRIIAPPHPTPIENIEDITTTHIETPIPFISSFTTAIIDDSNGQVIPDNALVPYGTIIRDTTTISTSWEPRIPNYMPPIPTGNVTYYRIDDCDAFFNLLRGERVPINPNNGDIPRSSPFALTTSQKVSYTALYSGDRNYAVVFAPCETVNIISPQINTVIRDKDDNDVGGTTLPIGTTIHDTAKIQLPDGAPSGTVPIGTVTYQRFNTTDCTGDHIDEPPVTINSTGGVPDSANFTLTSPGEVSYRAIYNGWNEGICEKGVKFQ
jgi:hypothetical protein